MNNDTRKSGPRKNDLASSVASRIFMVVSVALIILFFIPFFTIGAILDIEIQTLSGWDAMTGGTGGVFMVLLFITPIAVLIMSLLEGLKSGRHFIIESKTYFTATTLLYVAGFFMLILARSSADNRIGRGFLGSLQHVRLEPGYQISLVIYIIAGIIAGCCLWFTVKVRKRPLVVEDGDTTTSSYGFLNSIARTPKSCVAILIIAVLLFMILLFFIPLYRTTHIEPRPFGGSDVVTSYWGPRRPWDILLRRGTGYNLRNLARVEDGSRVIGQLNRWFDLLLVSIIWLTPILLLISVLFRKVYKSDNRRRLYSLGMCLAGIISHSMRGAIFLRSNRYDSDTLGFTLGFYLSIAFYILALFMSIIGLTVIQQGPRRRRRS